VASADRSAVDTKQLRAQLQQWITEDAPLGADEMVTGLVVIFCTEQMRDDGSVNYGTGRVYPLGEISPTVELGLLERAVRNARIGE
jgi:hypothetical protein